MGLERYQSFFIDQIRAADQTSKALHEIEDVLKNPDLACVAETDVYRLRRGLCLPSAFAACINVVAGERVIGETNKRGMNIGDMYKILVSEHGRDFKEDGLDLDNGWYVVTKEGDMYHHAIATLSQAIGIPCGLHQGFRDVHCFDNVLKNGGAVAVSLNNRFVIDKTLASSPDLVENVEGETRILIEGENGFEYRKFENGRHVVALAGIDEDDKYIVMDSFRLPQMEVGSNIMTLDSSEISPYLNYHDQATPRAIVFSPKAEHLDEFNQGHVPYVPASVVKSAKGYIVNACYERGLLS